MNNYWKFSSIPCIEESSFNKVLERFYNFGISGLVRENIQNSLDGKLPGDTRPVLVTIKTGTINKQDVPGLEEIKERILCLEGRNGYTKETIAHMRSKMNDEPIHYISFEDSHTKGLRGALNGQSDSSEDTWSIYAYNKGVHTIEADENLEKSRGGSHGIGKIASNAASELYMMYFANCDAEGNQHLGGTVQLIEHKYKEHFYRSTGYFTDARQVDAQTSKFYPFENNFHEVFRKDTRGLKIIIPFLREQFNDDKEILKSVCDSFFIAILQNKLEVILNDEVLNSKTIKNYITHEDYYEQTLDKNIANFTPLYFKTYFNQEPIPVTISDVREEYNFKLYFTYDEIIPKGRMAIIRTIGMKIEDKKITGNVNKPFNAVLIPDSIKEDAFLKSLENESHTELSWEHIKDQKLQRNAKRFINNMSKAIAKVIEEAIKKNNPTDGVMNTSDILYVVENQFKQDLAEITATVKLNQGNKDKTVVKVTTDIPRKPKSPHDPDAKPTSRPNGGLKQVRKPKTEDTYEDEREKIKFNAHPDIVERAILGDKEVVRFDFSGSEEVGKAKVCDIALAVVDGMGTEYANEFNMDRSYSGGLDLTTGKILKIEDNVIKDIVIKKGIAQIKLELTQQYNKAMKFVYYVEV